MILDRRSFLTGATVAAGAALIPLAMFGRRSVRPGRYGELQPDPAGILDLPGEFSYTVLERAGDPMTDGYLVPSRLDGMACFAGDDGTYVLMRNSEQTDIDGATTPYPPGKGAPEAAYDPASLGSVSRVVVDPDTLERVSSNLVLTGTERNCAGGPSPWGWLSCEETLLDRGRGVRHGYVFRCPIDADKVREPERIVAYGRFSHEAAAIDPATTIAYLTEDQVDACFYRFVPHDPGRPFEGQLQALALVGKPGIDTSNMITRSVREREVLACEWIDVPDPDPPQDDLRTRMRHAGAAAFRRSEGMWFHDGNVYVACTDGGPAGLGQLFRYRPGASPADGGTMELVLQARERGTMDHPDNVTVSPHGDVIFAEDDYTPDANYLRGMRPTGELYTLARNAMNPGELAGACFSPDGRVLFVNIYVPGLTLAITGPFTT